MTDLIKHFEEKRSAFLEGLNFGKKLAIGLSIICFIFGFIIGFVCGAK